MTMWGELRVILTWLRDEQPGTLLEFPDPRYKEGQSPPYEVTLAPSAVAVAEDLHRRFEENVHLTVGRLPYPPGRKPDRPLDHLLLQSPGAPLDPQEVEVQLDGPATVRSGDTLRHGLILRNLTGEVLTLATNGHVTAVVVDLQTGQVVGGCAEAQTAILVPFAVAPGTAERIPLIIGTASFRPPLGYTVPPGAWGIQIPLNLEREPAALEPRRTPILPLTVIA